VRILDYMERDGWVERRQDPADRRARRLFTKPAANPIIAEIWHVADRALAAAFVGLSAVQREQLASLLEHVHANLTALVPGVGEAGTPKPSTASKFTTAASPIRPTSKKVSP
jgi:MarR family transcriptional regulator, transcriptional regulator for hemolysin